MLVLTHACITRLQLLLPLLLLLLIVVGTLAASHFDGKRRIRRCTCVETRRSGSMIVERGEMRERYESIVAADCSVNGM